MNTPPASDRRREPTPLEQRIALALIPESAEMQDVESARLAALVRYELARTLDLEPSAVSRIESMDDAARTALLGELREIYLHWSAFSATESQADVCVRSVLHRRLGEEIPASGDGNLLS